MAEGEAALPPATARSSYQIWTYDKLRYGDTDRQGHVNNAVYSTFFETGRVEVLIDERRGLFVPGREFVIARIDINFRAELHWPGEIWIGTRVAQIGRSSVTFEQAIFQNATLGGTAESVIVQIDRETRKSSPWTEEQIKAFEALQ